MPRQPQLDIMRNRLIVAHGDTMPTRSRPTPRRCPPFQSADTLNFVIDSLGLRNGFPWWLPLLTAVIGALIAVIASQSSTAAWDADVHLWAREGGSASEYAELVLDSAVQESAASGMMASEDGAPDLRQVSVELNDTLIRVTVRATRGADAEALALSLAHEAIRESRSRYGDEAALELLGLVQPGARKVQPNTEWTAAWASALGLAGGFALAWIVATRTTEDRTTLGRLGRLGLRPLAVISAEAEATASRAGRTSSGTPVVATEERGIHGDDAVLLANAVNSLSGIVALVPLDDASPVTATLIQTARTLAARGRSVIWLDGRRPAFEIAYSDPPDWLVGVSWSPLTRSELILRRASRVLRPNGYVLLLTDPISHPDTVKVARSSTGLILMARADASDDALINAQLLLGRTPLLGVAVTHAQSPELRDFELAQMTE